MQNPNPPRFERRPPRVAFDGLVFRLTDAPDAERFVFDVACLRELLHYSQPHKLPLSPAEVLGLLMVRREPVVVIDLAKCLGQESAERRLAMLCSFAGCAVAFTAGAVDEVERVEPSSVAAGDRVLAVGTAAHILGVVKLSAGPATLLDAHGIAARFLALRQPAISHAA